MKLLLFRDLLLLVWFGVSFLIHLNGLVPWFFHAELANPKNSSWYLQTFREFGKTDQRYLIEDNLIICVQGLAGFINPLLCLIVIESIFNQRSWRYVTVMILSYLQALGGILYFMGAYHQNWKFITVANESSKFWSLFVFPNLIWIVIPIMLMLHSIVVITSRSLSTSGQKKK